MGRDYGIVLCMCAGSMGIHMTHWVGYHAMLTDLILWPEGGK